MCRALLYLGEPVLLDDLLFKPDNSLVKQAFMPRMLSMLNLAGFGMRAWDPGSHRPDESFSYASSSPPVFDQNLKSLAEKIRANCMLAHVRGVPPDATAVVSQKNVHPFCAPGHRIAMAHNGDLHAIEEIKPLLAAYVRTDLLRRIAGTTDSEWIYALLLSQLEDPTGFIEADSLRDAVERSFAIIRDARAQRGIDVSSSANLFITDGRQIAVVRYCFDFGRYPVNSPEAVRDYHLEYLSLWYTAGRSFGLHEGEWQMIGGSESADSVMVASEPLTRDVTTWLEVPEYSMLFASTRDGRPRMDIHYLDS